MYISSWKNLYLFQILSMLQWWSHINFLLIIRVLMMTRIGAVDGRDDDASRGCSGWYVVTAVSTEVLVITAEDNGSGGAGRIDRAAGGVTRWWHYAGGYHGDTLDVILPMRVMCTNKCTSHLLTDTHPGRMLVFTWQEVWSLHWGTLLLQLNLRPPEDLLSAGALEEA